MTKQSSILKVKNADFSDKGNKKSAYKSENAINCFLRFIKNNAHYFITALIISVFYLSCLITCKVFPFGNNTVAAYDMLAQIVPFIEHLFDVFEGKSSLLYSTAVAGGADLFGTVSYCLISPFTWIFLLFGKYNVYYGVALVIPLKLIAISFSAIYFQNKEFPKIPKSICTLFAVLYSYSGYTFVANTYISWMDFLIYLPFVVIGFKQIVSEGKIIRFSVSYALMIYTCFSLASFAMLIVFVIIVFYSIIVKRDDKNVLIKSCLALLTAVLISLPVMLPSLSAYLTSKRNKGLFENVNNDLNVTHLYRKISYVVTDVLFLFLTVLYFFKNGVKRPIDRFLMVTGVVLLFPVIIDECCNLLNGGSYLSYSLRFGFLNLFYVFYVASKYTSDYFSRPKTLESNVNYGEKKSIVSLLVLVAVVISASLYFVFSDKIINFIDGIYKKFNESDSYEFFSVFAHSLGGLEFLAPMATVIVSALIIIYVLYKKRLCSTKAVAVALCCLFSAQIGFYNYSLVKGNVSDPQYYVEYSKIARQIAETENTDNDYYRIKDVGDILTADAPLSTHTDSFSVFSSVIDKTNFTATDFFNYRGNGINISKSASGMFLGDMLLGYKYFICRNDRGEFHDDDSQVERSYTKKLDYTQQDGLIAYENLAVFPTAFTVSGCDLDFTGLNYAQKLNKLNRFLGGNGDICDEYLLDVSDDYDTDVEKLSDGLFRISVRIQTKESYWFLNTNFPEEYDLKYCRTRDFLEDNAKTLESGQDILFGFYKYKNASYTATVKDYTKTLTVKDIQKYCKVYGVRVDSVYNPSFCDKAYDAVWKNKVDYKLGSDTINLTVQTENDSYLFLSYVKLDGHSVTVNGKKTDFIDNGLDLMLIPLQKGMNNITVTYRSPYVKYAVFGLIGGLLLIFAVMLVLKNNKVYRALSNVIYYAGIALFIAVAGFFFIYPFALFLVKLIKIPLGLLF